jgi:hypothetical protein
MDPPTKETCTEDMKQCRRILLPNKITPYYIYNIVAWKMLGIKLHTSLL